MNRVKKLITEFTAIIVVCTNVSVGVFGTAAEDKTEYSVNLSENNKLVLSLNEKNQTIYKIDGKSVVYTGSLIISGKCNNELIIEKGIQNIIFKNVIFNDSIILKNGATANINVEGENKITAKVNESFWDDTGKAGINVPKGTTLNLFGNGELTSTGSDDGGLVWGDGGAGIGGNDEGSVGNINIKGKVTANGGKDAAGIGGGDNDTEGGNIYISGGKVTANGGSCGAGIGGGYEGKGGKITISGGTVYAYGGKKGAGIGIGQSSKTGDIIISGGTIFAYGGEGGSGIGTSKWGGIKKIKICNDPYILAVGGEGGSGIGTGYQCSDSLVEINGGRIYANGGDYGAGIGAGSDSKGHFEVKIAGGEVTATGGVGGAGIGTGYSSKINPEIKITGGEVTAIGGENGAGIGTGFGSEYMGNIKIAGGKITATGGENGAGIGSGRVEYNINVVYGDIIISEAEVKASVFGGANNASDPKPKAIGLGLDASAVDYGYNIKINDKKYENEQIGKEMYIKPLETPKNNPVDANNDKKDDFQPITKFVILDDHKEEKIKYVNSTYQYAGDTLLIYFDIPLCVFDDPKCKSIVTDKMCPVKDEFTKLEIRENVQIIDDLAFSKCNRLKEITAVDVETLKNQAFSECEELVSADIPTASYIGNYCFYACDKLIKVDFSKNTSNIEIGYFALCCKNLKDVYIGVNDPEKCIIDDTAFALCGDVTIHIPEGSKEAYEKKFSDNPEFGQIGKITFVDDVVL